MITITNEPYEEWLTTITNTRLIYNTMDELEIFLDNHSIHGNGIKRSFPTVQKMRAAYRDLKDEVFSLSQNSVNLSEFLVDYKRANAYYKEKLARRTNPQSLALEILYYCYRPEQISDISKKRKHLFDDILQQDIDIVILVLLLIKALPGYESKDGNVLDIEDKFDLMLSMFEEFLRGNELFKYIPTLAMAKEEEEKSRIKLIYHAMNIFGTYIAYAEKKNIYETANDLKRSRVPLKMAGYWNECGGTNNNTNFWEFKETSEDGVFFAYNWKKADNNIYPYIYTVCFIEAPDGKLIMYMMHPEAMKHRLEGKASSKEDHVWYVSDMPDSMLSEKLTFKRTTSSTTWKLKLELTRVTVTKLISQYEAWFKHCKVVNLYENALYDFRYGLHAVTQDYLYILNSKKSVKDDDVDGKINNTDEGTTYYKIPRNASEGLESINLYDNVGILTMGEKRYLAFDDIMFYIEITEENLQKYGILLTDRIV